MAAAATGKDEKKQHMYDELHKAAVDAARKVPTVMPPPLPPLPPLDARALLPRTSPNTTVNSAVPAAAATRAVVLSNAIDGLLSHPPKAECTNEDCQAKRFKFCPRSGNLCLDVVLDFAHGKFNCDFGLRYRDRSLRDVLSQAAGELKYDIASDDHGRVCLTRDDKFLHVLDRIDAICGGCGKVSGKFPLMSTSRLDELVGAHCSRVTSDLTFRLIKL
jgi:hypothetical protein